MTLEWFIRQAHVLCDWMPIGVSIETVVHRTQNRTQNRTARAGGGARVPWCGGGQVPWWAGGVKLTENHGRHYLTWGKQTDLFAPCSGLQRGLNYSRLRRLLWDCSIGRAFVVGVDKQRKQAGDGENVLVTAACTDSSLRLFSSSLLLFSSPLERHVCQFISEQ